jgi:hypothetical protein
VHVRAALALRLALLGPILGCGGSSGPPSPVPERQGDPAPVAAATHTALPADLPERLEIEYRRRSEDGDDLVLKLTPAGARYGLAHDAARVALRYPLPPTVLASVYATLQQEGFARLETTARDGASGGGTSLRVSTGSERHAVSAMGRQGPSDAQAYARCVAAVEALLPTGRSDVVVQLRWDASMAGQSAGLDIDVGEDLVGLHRVPGRAPAQPPSVQTFELHLARARPLQLQLLRGGKVPRSTTLTLQAGVDRGVEVVFDAERGQVTTRPLGPEPATAPWRG